MRDSKTEDILRHIGHGIKIKMDDAGNILIKRVSKNSVFVRATAEENAISNDVTKLFNGALDLDKPLKVSYNYISLCFYIAKLSFNFQGYNYPQYCCFHVWIFWHTSYMSL